MFRTLRSLYRLQQSSNARFIVKQPIIFRNYHATRFLREEFAFTQSEYLSSLQHTLENISDMMDNMIDSGELKTSPDQEIEVDISDGVLNLQVGSAGTFVVSRQTPSRQLWLSSPVSGPWHYTYDHVKKDWLCTKGKEGFFDRMDRELTQILGKSIHVKRLI